MLRTTHRQLEAALFEALGDRQVVAVVRVCRPDQHRVEDVTVPVSDLVAMLRAYDGFGFGDGSAFGLAPQPDTPHLVR